MVSDAMSNVRGVDALSVVRRIALALPETNERLSHGAPCFFIRDKKAFVYFHENFHGDGMTSIWCPAPPGVQEQMVEAEPDRYFRPPYLGPSGWIGLRLDIDRDDDELAAVITEGYRKVAPKKLVAELDA
jgi:hypothetical protein